MSDQKKESFRELLQRYHVGEQPQTREEGQPLPHRGLAPTTRFEPGEVCLPQISQTTDDLSHLDDCLVSIFVEDILEHSLPYIHAVPLFVAAKAYGITCKRVSLLCSIYLEKAIYRGKDLSAQSLIPDSEKRYVVGKLKDVLEEIPTLTTLSEQKENILRGEINRGYYKILSAFISKKDLHDFMSLAGEKQIIEAEGLPMGQGLASADRTIQQPPAAFAVIEEVQEPILSTEEIVKIWKRAIKKHARFSRQLDCALMRWLCRQGLDDEAGKEEVLAAEYGKPRQTIRNWEVKGLTEGKRLGLPPLL